MARKRTNGPVEARPDRIAAGALADWMTLNAISPNLLSRELGVEFTTVQGWLRGYRHPPNWLEQRINYEARAVPPRLPFYGKRWGET